MKTITIGIQRLILAASCFWIVGCHPSTDIGFGLGGDGDLQAIYTDTLTLGFSTVVSDSAVTGNSTYILSGKTIDPEFGTIEAASYFQITLSPLFNTSGGFLTDSDGALRFDTLTLKANPIIDSLNLRLFTTGIHYGDPDHVNKFTIHRLTENFQKKNYDKTEKLAYNPTPLGTFQLKSSDFINSTSGTPQAHFVKLPVELATELVHAGNAAIVNNNELLEKVRGFAIVPDKSNKTIFGFATGLLDISGYNSSLIPYWHYNGDTTASVYAFNINGPRHTSLDLNRAGTSIASLSKTKNELSIAETGGKLYVQGGTGISTKIDLSPLKKLGKIKISKAVLEFRLDPSTINTSFRKNFYNVLAEVGSNNQQKRLSNNTLSYIYSADSNSPAGLASILNDSTNYLNVDITHYLQSMVLDENFSKQVLLLPASYSSTTQTGILANDILGRSVFLKPRLLLYYMK